MLWFLRDYPLAAVILRALTLAFDALFIGGIFFCSVILPHIPPGTVQCNQFFKKSQKLLRIAAIGLAATQICFVALDSAMLISTSGLALADLFTANYFVAGVVLVATAIIFLIFNFFYLPTKPVWLLFIFPLLYGIVWTSHSVSRLEYRSLLMLLTGLHQLTVALWIGSMPYLWLLLSVRGEQTDWVVSAVRRYSATAVISVAVLIFSGIVTACFYTQSWGAVYGTAYGVVLIEKSILLAGLLLLGAGNFVLIRNGDIRVHAALLRIVRFSEVEIGIGFTIILAAASLSSQPPAVDLIQNRVTLPEIATRMKPHWPRLETPPISAMPAVQPLGLAMRQEAMSPEEIQHANNRVEQAWSEYNHHWAGIIVLLAGAFAVLGKWNRMKWARNWPLAFLGLAIFLFFRADPEAWPLGPRGFWASFYNPEDLQHRLYILLIVSFVVFEWGIQTERYLSRKAALVFPTICVLGGALLLTHDHSLGNVKEELLTNMTHTAIAICAVFAGWSRWLDVRASDNDRSRLIVAASQIWPVCLMAIGLILLNYRES